MHWGRPTLLVTALGSLAVGAAAGMLVTGLGVGARADEPPLPPLATRAIAADATTMDDDALPQQIENRGYACPAFTFLAPDGDHSAGARAWSVTLSRTASTRVVFDVACVKAADVGGLEAYVDALRRETTGPRLAQEPVVEVSPFGAAVRTDLTMSATATLTEWRVERDGWIVVAGVLHATQADGATAAAGTTPADAAVATAQAMLATWHWGPPGS
jgi:hypothetical protein